MVSVGWRFGVRHLLSTRSVRATPVECVCALPGDELITNPIGTLTHAVTIQRARPDVWQWLVQMGAGSRAGWYSYDSLDNRRQPSATRIVPELQRIDVGTLFPALPGTVDGFHVLQFEPKRSLVLGWRPEHDTPPVMSWAFVLRDEDDECTRLIVRVRGASGYSFYGLPTWIGKPLVRLVHFMMERKQLLGIARRAESLPRMGPLPRRAGAA
jgi:hypothetical protein